MPVWRGSGRSGIYSPVAIDPKHLPDDPKTLQQMVLDLMGDTSRKGNLCTLVLYKLQI
jgi:hypothetical protein